MSIERGENGDHNQDGVDQAEVVAFKIFMAETVVYRKEQTRRMDELIADVKVIIEKLYKLPCPERAAAYRSISFQLTTLWVFVCGLVMAVISDWTRK